MRAGAASKAIGALGGHQANTERELARLCLSRDVCRVTTPAPPDATHPAIRQRLAVSLLIGIASAVVAFFLHRRHGFWPDFVFPWAAARHLLAGRDPYVALPGGLTEPFETPLLYPLPTVLATVPFARLSLAAAGATMMGISAALLAFVLTRDGWHRLWMLASAPFIMAINLGQWSPLVAVAALEPTLAALVTLKPNIGLAAFVYRPSWRMVFGSAIVLALSLIALPRWPIEWLHAIRSLPGHPAPILVGHGLGLILLLSLLRWRSPEGRLLLVSACVPQLLLFSDQLILLLVARTKNELVALTACSQIGFVAWFLMLKDGDLYVLKAAPYVLVFVFIPALGVLLRQKRRQSDATGGE